METACGTQEMTLESRPELWERQACEYLRKSIWLATRPNQIFPSHSDWSRTGYVTQDRPIRIFLFEANKRRLVFWILKRLPNSSSPYNEQSTSAVKKNEEWVLDTVTCEARSTHSRHGGVSLRSLQEGLSFHLSTLIIAVVNVGSLQLPASIEATQIEVTLFSHGPNQWLSKAVIAKVTFLLKHPKVQGPRPEVLKLLTSWHP